MFGGGRYVYLTSSLFIYQLMDTQVASISWLEKLADSLIGAPL